MPNGVSQRILGRKPPKWNVGVGVGQAMQGAGKYYGQIAIEKKSAEALKASQDFQLERDQNAEDFQTSEREARELTASNASLAAETNADENGAITTTRLLKDIDPALIPEALRGMPEDTRIETRMNRNGEIVEVLGEDPDWVTDSDGTIGKASAGSTTQAKPTEAQIKYGIHGRNVRAGVSNIMRVIGAGDGTDGGYDLRSFQAFADQVSEAAGGLGNWTESPEGQKYYAARRRAGEALFKGESGAAGSDAEAQRYYSMFPSPGDRPEVVDIKMQMLEVSMSAFEEAANAGMSLDESVIYARNIAEDQAYENDFDIDTGDTFAGSGSIPLNSGLTDEDLQWLNTQ